MDNEINIISDEEEMNISRSIFLFNAIDSGIETFLEELENSEISGILEYDSSYKDIIKKKHKNSMKERGWFICIIIYMILMNY